jgi:hypothetical protein
MYRSRLLHTLLIMLGQVQLCPRWGLNWDLEEREVV